STSVFGGDKQPKPITLGRTIISRHWRLHRREGGGGAADGFLIEIVVPANQVLDGGLKIGRTGEVIIRHPDFEIRVSAAIPVSAVLDDLAMGFDDGRSRHLQRFE